MKEVYIIGAARTPIGAFLGGLSSFSAAELGAIAIKEAVKRANIPPSAVDEVIMGTVLQAGTGQNPARQASVFAGIPVETPAMTLNMVCGSGLKSVSTGAQTILCGDNNIVVVGGAESMSNAPFYCSSLRKGNKMGNATLTDAMIADGLTDAFNNYHMGITAENIAEKYNITRTAQDEFALNSQKKACSAIENKAFEDEIVPVTFSDRKGVETVIARDESPRSDTSMEALAKLRPAFKKDGTVTAGNASGISDGAAALVLASKEAVEKYGLTPLAKIVSYADAGIQPEIMGIGPVPAVQKALKKAGLASDDIDLFELNEAFAVQSVAVLNELGLPGEKVNINGGAIALGHPIGASGARILVTLLYSLKKQNKKMGTVSLCIGGGMGTAMIIEAL